MKSVEKQIVPPCRGQRSRMGAPVVDPPGGDRPKGNHDQQRGY
jgi:hypothetical protein